MRAWVCLGLAVGLLIAALDARAARPTFRGDSDYLIDTWETDDGLPENSATAMVQAADGYLWFGTFNGLVRFDGVKFTVLDPTNTPALPSPGIANLYRDKAGRLWVSTLGGLAAREEERWRAVGRGEGWAGDFVRTFAERANGDLLFTTFDGHVLEHAGGRLRALPAPPGEVGQGYLGFVDEAGAWWVVQRGFVGRWDGAAWVQGIAQDDLPSGEVGSGPARDGGLWLLIGRELRKYRGAREVSRRALPDFGGGFWSLHEDGAGNVWICTLDQGLYRVAPDGVMRHWTTANGLSYGGARFVFEDREQNLWVGTSGGGLMRFKRRAFQSFANESGLSERVVHSVSADGRGGVWVGTYGKGLFRLSEGRATAVPLSDASGRVDYVQSVLADRAGRVWVGSFNQGLWVVEGDRAKRVGGAELNRENVLALFEDSGGRIWIGGGRGLWVYQGGEFRERRDGNALAVAAVCGLAEDVRGDIWLTNGEAVSRQHDARIDAVTDADGRSIREVMCLKADAGGAVWLGTRNAGLLRWREGRLAAVDAAVGFPVKAVHAIVEDDRGDFWMPSGRGVVRAARRELHAVADGARDALPLRCCVYDTADGLAGMECAGGRQPVASYDGSGGGGGGRLWLATPKGVAVVDPARVQPSPGPPVARVEELTYVAMADDGRARRTRVAAPFDGGVSLPAGSQHVELHYTGLSLAAPEKVRFQVRLEGRDRDWQDVGYERVAHYHDPLPGDYAFRVRAAGPDGTWDAAGATLAFSIRPFVWQTIWFRVGLAVVLGLGVAGAVGLWVRSRHRRVLEAARRGREQSAALVRLAHSPAAAGGDLALGFAEVTEVAAGVLAADRVGVWLLGESGRDLRCADVFDARGGGHRQGGVVQVSDCPGYFQRLRVGRVIDAGEAGQDVGMADGDGADGVAVSSALHAAVRVSGELAGVVRFEVTGGKRAWRSDEVAFAAAVADDVAQALSSARRARAVRELRESEERFRLVVEAAPNGMIMVDGRGRIVMVNAEVERAFGHPRQKLVGRPIETILPARQGGGSAAADGAAGGVLGGRAHYGRHADGRPVPLELGVHPMDTAAGRFVLFSVTDLSERTRAEAQTAELRNELAHLSRVTMLGELSGSLAHELNQPLTSILSNAQAAQRFLARDEPDVREVGDILRDIVAEDKRAGEVIRRLRALFRKGDVQRQLLDVNEVLQDVLKLARGSLINQGVVVETRLAQGLAPVMGDRVQLQQVLLNLILNGGDAMAAAAREDRQLDVCTAAAAAAAGNGAGLRVSVSDRGCGVRPEDVERIFEPFFTTKSGGMGLGLAVCRTIVSGHGGRLWLQNNPERGATVHLVLPAAPHPARAGVLRGDGDGDGDGAAAAAQSGGALDQSLIVSGESAG